MQNVPSMEVLRLSLKYSLLTVMLLFVDLSYAINGEADSLLGVQTSPTAAPLTKQKTVRCFKENVIRDDGRNYEVEKIRKKEDVVESIQRTGRDASLPPGCVVVTSVREDESDHRDMTAAHFPDQYGSQYGTGGGQVPADIFLPHLPDPVKDVTLGHGPSFDFGSNNGLQSPTDLLAPRTGGGYVYGGGGSGTGGGSGVGGAGGGDAFVNFKDVSGGGPPAQQHNNGDNGDVIRTYQVSTNLRRQESFDHHAFGMEKGVKPSGFDFGFGGGRGGNGVGTNYETSANDIDQKIVNSGSEVKGALVSFISVGLCWLLLH